MKDKLKKHGKSTKYFLFRKILIISSIALLLSASIGIPVGIKIAQSYIHQRTN
ncbi:MAG: hypothetical protein MJ221_01400 [Bacilli bacterium]|nr:hypothetical protein [Bacilli bacterium]